MLTNEFIISATHEEVMSMWLNDDALFNLFILPEFEMWLKIQGVKIN